MPSPFRDDAPDVRLRVRTGNPLAEIYLIDHAFALRERGIGALDRVVAPGVYNVKAKVGDAVAEQLVLLAADKDINLAGGLAIGSAVPVRGTVRSRETDGDLAAVASQAVAAEHGHGARIFLMSRRWVRHDGNDGASPPTLTLLTGDGTALALPRPEPDANGTIGLNVAVTPGAYRVRWSDATGVVAEQSVPAVAGWQTQVFVLEDATPRTGPPAPVPISRTRVSVLLARAGFDPFEDQLRLVETARTALARERWVADGDVSALLRERADNPMLGLYGAHLMLLARDAMRAGDGERAAQPVPAVVFDQEAFDAVVGTLAKTLGADDPDVVALATQTTAGPASAAPIAAPPMLRRSWVLLVAASHDAPRLVPFGLWRQVRRSLPLRPFLMWSPGDGPDEDPWGRSVRAALAGIDDEATVRRVGRELLMPRAAIDAILEPADA